MINILISYRTNVRYFLAVEYDWFSVLYEKILAYFMKNSNYSANCEQSLIEQWDNESEVAAVQWTIALFQNCYNFARRYHNFGL